MEQVLESVGHLDDEDSSTREVASSCRILSVVGTSSYSTRCCQTICTLQMYMMEPKQQNRTMVCQQCTTDPTSDDSIYAWSSDKTSHRHIVERRLMVCVQAWCIDQLEKFSFRKQGILFLTAHMDHQFHCSLRLSHQVKLPTSCPIVKLVAIQNTYACILIFLTKQSMWSPVLLTKTFLLYSSTCLAMYASRATGSL